MIIDFVLLYHSVFTNCIVFFQNVLGKCTISNYYKVFVFERQSQDEIQVELTNVYGEQSLSLPTIKRWVNEFKAGRTSVVAMKKYGRPCEINEKNNVNWGKSFKMKEESQLEGSQRA